MASETQKTRHSVSFDAGVVVIINDPDVIERVTGPGGDEWRKQVYGSIRTADDVIEHLARNCLANGVERANRLDGWADLPDDAATMGIEGIESGEVVTQEAAR